MRDGKQVVQAHDGLQGLREMKVRVVFFGFWRGPDATKRASNQLTMTCPASPPPSEDVTAGPVLKPKLRSPLLLGRGGGSSTCDHFRPRWAEQ